MGSWGRLELQARLRLGGMYYHPTPTLLPASQRWSSDLLDRPHGARPSLLPESASQSRRWWVLGDILYTVLRKSATLLEQDSAVLAWLYTQCCFVLAVICMSRNSLGCERCCGSLDAVLVGLTTWRCLSDRREPLLTNRSFCAEVCIPGYNMLPINLGSMN